MFFELRRTLSLTRVMKVKYIEYFVEKLLTILKDFLMDPDPDLS